MFNPPRYNCVYGKRISMYQLGIDFGTSFTKAAVFEVGSNNYYPIPLCDVGANRKDRSIPSVAYVHSGEHTITIGDEAVNSKRNVNGTFYYNFKPELDTINEAARERHDVIERIIVTFFQYIKCKAEMRFDQIFDDVVITIPASAPKSGVRYNFMEHCAQIAGFSDVLIIPEPVAAAYYLLGDRVHSKEMDEKLFLIYDFGGGTFDTSIIKVSDGQIQVIDESVGSDNEQKWGGIYIDSLVSIDYIRKSDYAKRQVAILKDRTSSFEQRLNASEHLREYPVRAKIELSTKVNFTSPYSYTLSRKDFDVMIQGMVNNTIEATLSLIERAHKENLCENIHSVYKVFLVGGTSQIPLVTSRWQFQKSAHKANFSIDAKNELNIIALGAARYRDLRLSPQQLNTKGKEIALSGNYRKAAAYFNNAGDGEGLYNLGLLYYLGVIGRKRQPAKAYKLFLESNYKDSKLLMALMKFNNDGVIKDDKKAKELLGNLPDSALKVALESVLSGGRSHEDLNTIYQFDVKSLFVKP